MLSSGSEVTDFDDQSSHCSVIDYSEAASLSQGGETKSVKDDHEAVQLSSITKNENHAVFCLRMFLMACLLVSAVLVSVFVYMYTSTEEKDSFESQFESDALKLLEAIGTTLDLTLGAADSFMIRGKFALFQTIFSEEKTPVLTWPMCSLLTSGLASAINQCSVANGDDSKSGCAGCQADCPNRFHLLYFLPTHYRGAA